MVGSTVRIVAYRLVLSMSLPSSLVLYHCSIEALRCSELRLLFLVVTLSIAFAPILSYETPELNWFAHKK